MSGGKSLWIWEHLPQTLEENADKSWLNEGDAVENVHRIEMSKVSLLSSDLKWLHKNSLFLGGHQPGTFARVCSGARFPHTIQHDIDLLDLIGKLVQPGGHVKIVQAVGDGINGLISANKLASQMKLAGLVGVQAPKTLELGNTEKQEIATLLKLPSDVSFYVVEIESTCPSFAKGSSTPLSFAQKIKEKSKPEKKVWNLADTDDDDVDLIDQDELLDEEDLEMPDQASLRVCGTTGKRKACKDCSCGLAEELNGDKDVPKKSFNSSCGSVSIPVFCN